MTVKLNLSAVTVTRNDAAAVRAASHFNFEGAFLTPDLLRQVMGTGHQLESSPVELSLELSAKGRVDHHDLSDALREGILALKPWKPAYGGGGAQFGHHFTASDHFDLQEALALDAARDLELPLIRFDGWEILLHSPLPLATAALGHVTLSRGAVQ